MRKIQVEIKSVYGEEKCYPSCADAKRFAQLTNCKTLTRSALKTIAALGYSIEVVKVGSFGVSVLYTMPIESGLVAQ